MFLNLTPTPKIAPKDKKIDPKGQQIVPKGPKRGPKYGRIKAKDRAVLPKPKLIVCIGMLQKSV